MFSARGDSTKEVVEVGLHVVVDGVLAGPMPPPPVGLGLVIVELRHLLVPCFNGLGADLAGLAHAPVVGGI